MSSFNTDESSILLWYEQAINAGAFLGAFVYGLHIAVFYSCLRLLRERKKTKSKWFLYASMMFILGTANISCIIHFNELAWIDQRNYSGGPAAFLLERSSEPSNVGAIATSIVIQAMSGLLLILRCHTLWRRVYVTVSLCLVLLASTIISILHCVQVARQTVGSLEDSKLIFSIPFASLLMSLNIAITLVLLSRLFCLRQRAKSYPMSQDFKNNYMSYEALVFESALPSATVSLIFFVLYGLRNPGAVLVFPLLVQSMAVTADMIVLRIIRDHVWTPTVADLALERSAPEGRGGRSTTHGISLSTFYNDSGPPADVKRPELV